MADGKVTIDTAIDPDGIKAGSKEVEAAVRRLAGSIDGIGTSAKKSLEKQVASFEKMNQQYAAQEQKVQQLKNKIAELESQKIPTDEFKEIGKQIDTDTAKLNRLMEQQRLFEETGGRTNSRTYRARQLQIEELTKSIEYAKGEQEDLLNSGGAYTMPDTSRQTSALAAEEKKLSEMNARVQQSYNDVAESVDTYKGKATLLAGVLSRLKNIGENAVSTMKRLAGSLAEVAKEAVVTGLKKISSGILGIHKSANKSTISLSKMMKYLFGIRSLYTLFNKMRSALVSGFKNLVQYSGETNAAISSVMSALTQLKNSFATAFAPIVTTVSPYLVKFINLISECVTRVGMFIAALTGKSTFTKAVTVQEDYAASLDKTSKNTNKAAKAAKNYLSPLDEIDRYESNKDTSTTPSGGKYTGPSPSDMFEEVPIESSIKGVADKIKNLVKSEDWEGLGAYIASGINSGLQKIYDVINWNNVGPKITRFTNAFTRTFNSLVDHIDWDLMGRTIGAGINTIVYTLNQLITGINWKNLGKKFAAGLNGIVKEVDASALGQLIGNKLMIIPNIVYGVVKNLNWGNIGTAIGNALNGVVRSVNLGTIGTTLGTAITGVFRAAISFAKTFDWKALGENIYTGVNNLLNSLDFTTIGQGITAFALGLLDSLGTAIQGVDWEKLGSQLVTALLSIDWGALALKLAKIGLMLVQGILQGILSALKTIGIWLKEHFVDPIVDAVKELFGIHSPSTVFEEIGKMLMQGLLNGIESFVEAIKSVFNTLWGGIKSITETVWKGIKDNASGIWNGMKDSATTIFGGIKDTVGSAWDRTKEYAGTSWDKISGTVSRSWNGLKTGAKEIFEDGIFKTISGTWDDLKENVPEAAKQIKDGITDRFTEARDSVKNIFEKLADYVKIPLNGAIKLVNGGIGKINGALGALENAFSFGPWEIPTPFGSKTIGFSASFPRVSTLPYLAKGAVIPPKSEFLAVLGDQKNGRNLEAPEDLIRQIVREESGQGGGNYRFTAQINRRTVFDEMIDEAKLRQNTTGRNPFELA